MVQGPLFVNGVMFLTPSLPFSFGKRRLLHAVIILTLSLSRARVSASVRLPSFPYLRHCRVCGTAVGCVAGMEISALYLLTTEMARVGGGTIKEIFPVLGLWLKYSVMSV